MQRFSKVVLAAVASSLLLTQEPALAHHVMGGETPAAAWQGLLSGLGHPIIGPDHLAFVVAVGLVSGLAGNALLLPLLFIAGTIVGCFAHVLGLDMPFSELAIALTLCAAAVIVAWRLQFGMWALAMLFAASGMVHGYAYGESIIGAEPAPLAAYVLGFGIVQLCIAAAAAAAMRLVAGTSFVSETTAHRAAGAAIALVAAASLVNSIIAA